MPISTCSTMLDWCGCSYSIGSSIMTMWRCWPRLISSISPASVVLLPDPLAPPIKHEATRQLCQLFYRRRQAESGEPWDALRQQADRRSGASAFAMEVDAEPAGAGNAERRVRNRRGLIESPRVRCERGEDCVLDIHAVEWTLAERLHTSIDRGSTGGAPATRSRSLPPCVASARSQRSSRDVSARPRGRLRRTARVQLVDQLIDVVVRIHQRNNRSRKWRLIRIRWPSVSSTSKSPRHAGVISVTQSMFTIADRWILANRLGSSRFSTSAMVIRII